jgi:membrane-bound ClpP family serine protease
MTIIGSILGYWLGYLEWSKLKPRIDKRNIVILYATDSGLYSILIFLFLIQYAPRALLNISKAVQTYYAIYISIIIITVSSWCGRNLAFWQGVKAFESTHGKLTTKSFWSRSHVGQEGMLSKQGIVIESLKPIGRVRIDSETWNAESIDKNNIEVEKQVIVRDIDGLKLIVEKLS